MDWVGRAMLVEKICRSLVLGGLALSIAVWSVTYSRSFAYGDQTVKSSVFALGVAGGAILWINWVRPGFFATESVDYDAVPLEERTLSGESRFPATTNYPLYYRPALAPRVLIFALIICMRVELLRRIAKNLQCSQPGIESLLPLLLAVVDSWKSQHNRPAVALVDGDGEPANSNNNIAPAFLQRLACGRRRYLVSTLFLSVGSMLAARATAAPRSTYICARVSRFGILVPLYQYIGVLLDCFTIAGLGELLESRTRDGGAWKGGIRRPVMFGKVFLTSAAVLSVEGIVIFLLKPDHRRAILAFNAAYLRSLTEQTGILTFAIILVLKALSYTDILALSVVVHFVCTYISGFAAIWEDRSTFVLIHQGADFSSLLLYFFGAIVFLQIESVSTRPAKGPMPFRLTSWHFGSLSILFILRVSAGFLRGGSIAQHPLDSLIQGAITGHEGWLKQASLSTTLVEAIAEYQRRYHRNPPAGFDEWYNYATSRSSVIIDDYDGLHNDLLPFWNLPPSELRLRTQGMTSNPWNDISRVSIRNGTAGISSDVLPTHRWMLEGVASMINNFASSLPDMDIALNLNDEPRVAIPWTSGATMPRTNTRNLAAGKGWSVNRAEGWETTSKENKTKFEQHSFQNTFYNYGAVACPPESKARKQRIWASRDSCTGCASPHSLGQFVSNWTSAADICHQPDMANLHGLYLSPAAFKPTHDLMPVFSQSKAQGFSDILYPSAWNYMDKIKYEPTDSYPDIPYGEKRNSLFWRGATSEGYSRRGEWKGMTRQRFVHLANNASQSLPILLSRRRGYSYENVPAVDLRNLIDVDVAVVDKIDRCGSKEDCVDQAEELGLSKRVDFQHHWTYRYLFDLDGAGFSGRFLPFLQSRSLPFKTALFREWYDSRLTAWFHFVPQDLRFLDLHSTLAYFAGLDGNLDQGKGRRIFMEPHKREGHLIAKQGREWAGKVLRKEDMEIYFFRLLLEWGRLTDDNRDEIGLQISLQ